MPELPEVETVVRDLSPCLVGKRIAGVKAGRKLLRRPWRAPWSRFVAGRGIRRVHRRGKWIILDLDPDGHLVLHLGMTGQLQVFPSRTPLADHTHLVFSLEDGARELRFRDVRRFGSATWFASPEKLDQFFRDAGLGPEPFDLNVDYWRECLGRTRRCLKAVLLDQRVVAGVGNIYADESLFEARLHPSREGRKLTPAQIHRLRRAVVVVLNRAIDRRGSSIRDYLGGSGQKGNYQEEFRVYGRTSCPCPRCGSPIVCIRLAGRSTHFCPRCQAPPRVRMNPRRPRT